MKLEFHGAAGEVTGSLHRLVVGDTTIALDCGMFQGHRAEANAKNRELPGWARQAHAVVLSHAHLDHSGNLPTLVKAGFAGNIYATPATRDLCSVMLRDSAMIQDQDARYLNRKRARNGEAEPIVPLYDVEDVQHTLAQMITLPLERPLVIGPGVKLTFFEAGHVLGSALSCLDLEEDGRRVRLLYTGDLGRRELPLLKTPQTPSGVNVLVMESTYGNRSHGPTESVDERLAEIVGKTLARKGRVLIPTFALERAQEVLFALGRLHAARKIPRVPIYIDSPLAIAITEIYKLHPESLEHELRDRLLGRDDPFSPPGLRYVSSVEDSRALQESGEPCIVLAGSGMCEGGRILHHLGQGLGRAENSVVIVGYQAQHTLGRRLVEGRRKVRVFGVERDVRAEVYSLEGLSAHADREGLLDFALALKRHGGLHTVALVHGEPEARDAFAAALTAKGCQRVICGLPGDTLSL